MTGTVEAKEYVPFRGVASIPCDRMTGTALVREPESFSRIHLLAMKFVREDGTVSGLLSAFGLGHQVMQEVLADLVLGEAVRIDLESDIAVVCEPYDTLLAEGRMEEIEAALYRTREIKKVTWVLDKTSGHVFIERDISRYLEPPRGIGGSLSLPTMPNCPELKKTPDTVLARAAIPMIEEILRESDVELSRVEQIEDKRRLPSLTLYVPVHGVRMAGTDREYLVPEAPGIPSAMLDAWTKLLNRNRESVELPVVREEPQLAAATPALLAKQMENNISELKSLMRLDILSGPVNDQIGRVLQRLRVQLRTADDMERSLGRTTWAIGDRKRQLEFLAEVIDNAQELVIVGSAFASLPGFRSVMPALRNAAERGVQISLVIGLPGVDEDPEARGRKDESELETFLRQLDPALRNAISLQRAVRPFHAKFVIVDGQTVCASSHNWLTGLPHGGPTEVSVATDAPLAVAQASTTILKWLQPDSRAAVKLNSQLRRTKRKETRKHFFKKRFEAIESAWVELFAHPSAAGRAVLDHELEKTRALLPELADMRPVLPVIDDEHRSHLFRVTAEADRKLIIASDAVLPNAAGERFTASVRDAAKRGVNVRVVWGRHTSAGPENIASTKTIAHLRTRLQEEAEKAKAEGKALTGEILIPAGPCGSHAKALLVDDSQALISSFNFLSFGAERPAVALSAELGFLAFDPDLVKEVERGLR